MTDKHKHHRKNSFAPWVILGVVVLVIGFVAYLVKGILSDDTLHRKETFTQISILKPPPPPPPVKEKPPEPEIKQVQKEEVFTPEQEQDKPAGDNDDTPAGDNLGVDAEGTAGGDAFGLVGKKGGRSLIAGGEGNGGNGMGRLSLLTKYAFYTQVVEAEIRKKVLKQLDENGGGPKGNLQTVVRISLDPKGTVVNFKIVGSSGNTRMDDAVNQTIGNTVISEPPPDGMPRTMTIKISYRG
jgi:protein TonB